MTEAQAKKAIENWSGNQSDDEPSKGTRDQNGQLKVTPKIIREWAKEREETEN